MNIPVYPHDFHDWSKGVDISDARINQWIRECVEDMEKNPECNSRSIASGDTRVEVCRVAYGEDTEDTYYDVIVSKGYKSKSIENENYI